MKPGVETRWMRLVRGEPRDVWERLAVAGMWALSVGYAAALGIHHGGYRFGLARRTRLSAKVISIGNLTVGGTGKTTAAMGVARWLSDKGVRVGVLSRGYGGRGERKSLVVSEGFGPLIDVREAGDEAFLMARSLPGVFVLVGKDRRRTGRRAVEEHGVEALVMDDGFQYQRLEKDVEGVPLDALAPFGYDSLVPRGLLREPVRHLARADAVWITHCDLVRRRDLEGILVRLRRLAPDARVWETAHTPVRLRRLGSEEKCSPKELQGRQVCALSSLGNPEAFERTLERMGAVLVGRARFPDHHEYRAEELAGVAQGEAASAEWVVTTEKDEVRLPGGYFGKPGWVRGVERDGWGGAPGLAEELECLLADKTKT